MRIRFFGAICLLACLSVAIPALAQRGYPLKGTWSGDWGPSLTERQRVLLQFDWDGQTVSGMLNPGPNEAPMRNVRVELPPPGTANAMTPWRVHFESETRDESGNLVPVVVDGSMENLGAFRRVMTGVWVQGNVRGTFRVVMN